MRLAGKTAIVTGGGSGFGAAIAVAFAREGAQVVIADIDGAAAERVGLDPAVLRRRLRGYSRGMLQRIGVAQALLGDPELLFLDEPASGTDPNGVALVRERILEAKQRGATIVLNSHQLPEVERSLTDGAQVGALAFHLFLQLRGVSSQPIDLSLC